jgi:hypothetical protein
MAHRIHRWLGIATLLIGYPLLVHHTNESAHSGYLGALLAIAPVLLFALVLIWRSARRTFMLGALVFIAEYWVRRRALPDMQHAHILDAVRAFRDSTARPR